MNCGEERREVNQDEGRRREGCCYLEIEEGFLKAGHCSSGTFVRRLGRKSGVEWSRWS